MDECILVKIVNCQLRVFKTSVSICYRTVRGAPTTDWSQIMIKLYAFFWVITQRLEFICRRFGTLCLFHLHRQVDPYED